MKQIIETYIHNKEVQPAPSVGEVGLETIGHPFKEHLHDEDVGENFICILKDNLDGPAPF